MVFSLECDLLYKRNPDNSMHMIRLLNLQNEKCTKINSIIFFFLYALIKFGWRLRGGKGEIRTVYLSLYISFCALYFSQTIYVSLDSFRPINLYRRISIIFQSSKRTGPTIATKTRSSLRSTVLRRLNSDLSIATLLFY